MLYRGSAEGSLPTTGDICNQQEDAVLDMACHDQKGTGSFPAVAESVSVLQLHTELLLYVHAS